MRINIQSILFLVFIFCQPYVSYAQLVAAGGRHSLAICSDSTVHSWGYNGYGQLGNGRILEENKGVKVTGLSGIIQVAGGLFHSLFVKQDGTVWACGRNPLGPLGDGTIENKTTPVQVVGLTNIIQAAGGGEHSLFLKNDGSVWASGLNSSGQLGDGTNINKTIAVKLATLSDIVQVAAGAEFSLFLKKDGTVWACGHNGFGQFGNGTISSKNIPIQIPGLSGIKQISAGEWHSLFVTERGEVYSSGRNNYGQLGDGSTLDKKSATLISSLTKIIQAEAGGIHSVFIKNDGSVWSCGLNSGGNNDGQLGDGTNIDKATPVQVISSWGADKIIRAEATREHSLYLTETGQIWASGRNNYGQLGNSVFSNSNSHTSVHSSSICQILPLNTTQNNNNRIKYILYPNPTKSHISLKFDIPLHEAKLLIYNSIGNKVKQYNSIFGYEIKCNLHNIPFGIYYFQLMQNNKTISNGKIAISD